MGRKQQQWISGDELARKRVLHFEDAVTLFTVAVPRRHQKVVHDALIEALDRLARMGVTIHMVGPITGANDVTAEALLNGPEHIKTRLKIRRGNSRGAAAANAKRRVYGDGRMTSAAQRKEILRYFNAQARKGVKKTSIYAQIKTTYGPDDSTVRRWLRTAAKK